MQFCILVAAGVLGGWWLDGRLGILPVFTILGTLCGSTVAFYTLYRSVFDRKKRR
jgi:F0F1-type ATP synthase assembly protein I